MDELIRRLARRRVTLGFVATMLVLAFARPTWSALAIGFAIALVGEAVRVWAAGHLEKRKEVTRSGPYQWIGHPLYLGSGVIALGAAVAAHSAPGAVVTGLYVAITITAAVRVEEGDLREAFGSTYQDYRDQRGEPMKRRFSVSRAVRNGEHRAIGGLLAGFGLLALKLVVPL
jgi:protein-S-isoprenylcysteine O-methyltransferase Ste14